VIAYARGHRVHELLQRAVSAQVAHDAQPLRVSSLAGFGMGPLDYYALVDPILESSIDGLVIGFNLGSLSAPWRALFTRSPLLALVAPHRLPEAVRLSLPAYGVRADELLLGVTIEQLGLRQEWNALTGRRVRASLARSALEDWIAGHDQGPERRLEALRRNHKRQRDRNGTRYSVQGALANHAEVMGGIEADNPTLALFHAALRRFRAAHLPVVVYTVPVNVEYLERIGVLDEEGLDRTLASLRWVTQDAGAVFVDGTRLFGDEEFRDAGGHFKSADRLVELLAPRVVTAVRDAARGDD